MRNEKKYKSNVSVDLALDLFNILLFGVNDEKLFSSLIAACTMDLNYSLEENGRNISTSPSPICEHRIN